MKRRAAIADRPADSSLTILNRQRTHPVNSRLLRRVVQHLLTERLALRDFDLVIHLIDADEMTRLNETRLRHAGSTDVITFDYGSDDSATMMAGEIFVCADEAVVQSRRFKVTWQEELVRYIVHGILHLHGYDDVRAASRKRMKTEENSLVRTLSTDFDLRKLQRKSRLGA